EALIGHVINTFKVPGLKECQHKCYVEDRCLSYNMGPVEGQIRTCEVNDIDNVTLPGKVKPKQGFEYCPIKNPCSSSPCASDKVCRPDSAWDSFTCSDGLWAQWGAWDGCVCPRMRNRTCINPFTGASCGQREEMNECKSLSSIEGGSCGSTPRP
ncbi:hypothetical protein QZH41_017120, partial [Actinostola sp. cb2023]